MRHGFAAKRPCVKFMVIGEDIVSGEMQGVRSVVEIKLMITGRVLEIPRKEAGRD